jgi:predicted anti-sigma-YlaC factor YlaD
MTTTNVRPDGSSMRLALLLLAASAAAGCSVRGVATRAVADAVSAGGGGYGADDDPELVRDAVPFGLKAMEGLLEEQPRHAGLLAALASGFTQYAYAFVQQEADARELEGRSAEARALRSRARRLYLRARDYGLRGLDLAAPGVSARLRALRDPPGAASALNKEQLPLVYWSAASWALAISAGKEDMALVAELPAPEALMRRALQLDENWNDGALHEFFVSFEASRPGGSAAAARGHLAAALAAAGGRRYGPLVAWAEGPLVQAQDRAEFTRLLTWVANADPDRSRPDRLANAIAQRRARLLLAHADDLFN